MTTRVAGPATRGRSGRVVAPARVRAATVTLASNGPIVLAMAAGSAATGWVAALLIGRVEGLTAPPYDLAFFQQVVWNIAYGTPWTSSFHEGSFLGLHLSPALVVPAAVERLLGADARVLSLFHALAIGALVPAAFLFLRTALRPARAADALAAGLAAPIPIWAAMQDVVRSDFHPEAAGVVLALLAGAAGLSGRVRAMWLLAAIALATREDVSYAVGVVALVVAARGRGRVRRHGSALFVAAIAWALLAFGVLMPWFRAGAVSDTAHYYAWLGGGAGVLAAPFTMPDRVIEALTRVGSWSVLGAMTVSLVCLPLLRPRWAALVLPPMVALLLSAHWPQAALRFQYPLILVTPLLAATALGGRRALAIIERRRRIGRRRASHGPMAETRRPPAVGVLLVALLVGIPGSIGALQGSIPPFSDRDPAFAGRPPMMDRVGSIAERVPAGALLSTDEGLVATVASRSAVGRLVAGPVPDHAYALVDRQAWLPTTRIAGRRDEIIAELRSADRAVLIDDGRFILWGPAGQGRAP